jgi:hypothetical protein
MRESVISLVNGHLTFDIVATTLVIAHLCLHRSTYIFCYIHGNYLICMKEL